MPYTKICALALTDKLFISIVFIVIYHNLSRLYFYFHRIYKNIVKYFDNKFDIPQNNYNLYNHLYFCLINTIHFVDNDANKSHEGKPKFV